MLQSKNHQIMISISDELSYCEKLKKHPLDKMKSPSYRPDWMKENPSLTFREWYILLLLIVIENKIKIFLNPQCLYSHLILQSFSSSLSVYKLSHWWILFRKMSFIYMYTADMKYQSFLLNTFCRLNKEEKCKMVEHNIVVYSYLHFIRWEDKRNKSH